MYRLVERYLVDEVEIGSLPDGVRKKLGDAWEALKQ
jgi:hypothetical protein